MADAKETMLPAHSGESNRLTRDQIVVENLGKIFTSDKGQLCTTALENVNLWVQAGQFCSILGPSGCGKSTLLRLLGGLVEPTRGTISLGGNMRPRDAQRAKEIGFVFQRAGLLPWKTVAENVEVAVQVNGKANRPGATDVQRLLGLVNLSNFAHAYPHQLSGGMQQRVAIARALAINPKLLLMDEPFGALDEITRQSMRYELLNIWQREQTTVVFVTHSITEAIILSDVVTVLSPLPGRVKGRVEIELERPRTLQMERSPKFLDYADRLTDLLREERTL